MTKLGLPTVSERYAGPLAAAYRRVAVGAVGAANAEIDRQTAMLAHTLEGVPVPAPILTLITSSGYKPSTPVSAADVQARIGVLQRLAADTQNCIKKEIERLTAAANRYTQILEMVQRQVAVAEYHDPALNAALGQFENDVRVRCSSLSDKLAENRYDTEAYRRLLIDELLDMVNLAQVMSGAAEVGYKQQRERWHTIATELGIGLSSAPPRSAFDIEALVQTFLQSIQLTYERPGVLKSIAQAFNRGKYHERLLAEVNAGLEQMRPQVIEAIAQAWQQAEQRWCIIAQAAAQIWLQTQTGTDVAGVDQQTQMLQQKLVSVVNWQGNLATISAEQMILGWRATLTAQAAQHMASQLQVEIRSETAS